MPSNPTIGSVGALGPLQPFEWNTPPPAQVPLTGTGGTGGTGGGWSSATYINPSPGYNLQILYTGDQDPAGQLFGQDDEDFWQNPVVPVVATLLWPQPWSFDVQEATIVPPIQDEDFWANPVAPVAASNRVYLPAQLDGEEIPAGNLFIVGTPTESWSTASILNAQNGIALRYQFDPQDPGGALAPLVQPDEDFWINPVAPFIPEPTILQFSDEWAINPNFDEDFWANPVAPVAASNIFPQPWSVEEDFQTPAIFQGGADEDFWANPVAPLWQTLLIPQQWRYEQNEPGNLFGQFDEHFWASGVSPIWQFPLVPQQWQYEQNEITTQILHADDDDSFWSNPVAPVATSMWQALPINNVQIWDDANLFLSGLQPPRTSNWLSPNAHMKVSK